MKIKEWFIELCSINKEDKTPVGLKMLNRKEEEDTQQADTSPIKKRKKDLTISEIMRGLE